MEDYYSKYKLSKEIHYVIYKAIEDHCLSCSNKACNPIIVIIAGQPGAGKSELIEIAVKEVNRPVIINGDELRKFHPFNDEIIINHNEEYSKLTDLDVRTWTEKLLNKSIEDKYNCIFECTMRTNQICNTINKLKEMGFFVNIKITAVNEFDSRLGIYERYEKQVQVSGNGRYVPIKSHDDAYKGLLLTLNEIENENLFDFLQVYSRDRQVIYQKDCKNVNCKACGACDAISEERNKEWNEDRICKYIIQLEKIIKSMETRRAKNEMINEVMQLKENVLKQFNKNLYKDLA